MPALQRFPVPVHHLGLFLALVFVESAGRAVLGLGGEGQVLDHPNLSTLACGKC